MTSKFPSNLKNPVTDLDDMTLMFLCIKGSPSSYTDIGPTSLVTFLYFF